MMPEDALPFAKDALEQNGISIENAACLRKISEGLALASQKEFYQVRSARARNEDFKRRCIRINLLESLLEEYRLSREIGKVYTAEDGSTWNFTRRFVELHGKNYEEILSNLEFLISIERKLCRFWPDEALPNSRPTTAKNAGAEEIFVVLKERGIATWAASAIIADMLIMAGIANGPRKKIHRALYDKLQRL